MEYVEVRVRVPKPIVDFVKALVEFSGFDFEAFWERELVNTVHSIISAISGPYVDSERLIERYGLREVLKDC